MGHLVEVTFPSILDASALEYHALMLYRKIHHDEKINLIPFEDVFHVREGNKLTYTVFSEYAEDFVFVENAIREMGQGAVTYSGSDFAGLRKKSA